MMVQLRFGTFVHPSPSIPSRRIQRDPRLCASHSPMVLYIAEDLTVSWKDLKSNLQKVRPNHLKGYVPHCILWDKDLPMSCSRIKHAKIEPQCWQKALVSSAFLSAWLAYFCFPAKCGKIRGKATGLAEITPTENWAVVHANIPELLLHVQDEISNIGFICLIS